MKLNMLYHNFFKAMTILASFFPKNLHVVHFGQLNELVFEKITEDMGHVCSLKLQPLGDRMCCSQLD